MFPRPEQWLLRLAGYFLKLFVIWLFAFAGVMFFVMLFNAPDQVKELLIVHLWPLILKFGATTTVLMIAGVFIDSIR
jgi:hypothetical protein